MTRSPERTTPDARSRPRRALPLVLLALTACSGPVRIVAPTSPDPAPTEPGPGTPRIHVTLDPEASPKPVELHQVLAWDLERHDVQGPGGGMWSTRMTTAQSRVLCVAPCATIIDARRGQELFFAGPGVAESAHLSVFGGGRDIHLSVRPGSATAAKLGTPLTSIGVAGTLLSAMIFAMTFANKKEARPAAVSLGVSTAILATGIVLIWKGKTTFTELHPEESAAR